MINCELWQIFTMVWISQSTVYIYIYILDEITGGGYVKNTTKGIQDCLIDSNPPQTLSALTLGVDQKTNSRNSKWYLRLVCFARETKRPRRWRQLYNCGKRWATQTKHKSLRFLNGLKAFMSSWQFMPKNIQKRYGISLPMVKLSRKFPKTSGDKAVINYFKT